MFDETLNGLLKPIENVWFKKTEEGEFRFVYNDESEHWTIEETCGSWTKEDPLDSSVWSLDVAFLGSYIDAAYEQFRNKN